MKLLEPSRFAALLGAWCLGASIIGWYGAALATTLAALTFLYLDRKDV